MPVHLIAIIESVVTRAYDFFSYVYRTFNYHFDVFPEVVLYFKRYWSLSCDHGLD